MKVSDSPTAPSKGAPRRKRAAHLGPERRRPLVLDAAYDLFIENGFEGTSMDAIAAAAGVSKPVVYDCFTSKDELFTAMLDREEERILVETGEALATTGTADDPEATLIRGFQVFLEAAQKSPDIYRVVFLGEGGGNEAVAARIAAGIELQARTASNIAAHWVERYSDLAGRRSRGGRRAPRPHDRRPRTGRRPHPLERLRRLDARDAGRKARPHGLGRPRRHLVSARTLVSNV